MTTSEFSTEPYLNRQLLAYIGNKRRLIPFLSRAFKKLESRASIKRFADPFAGTGVVSRLAKYMGYEVYANDWEFYSYIVCSAHLGVDKSGLERLFSGKGGSAKVFSTLRRLRRPSSEKEAYISRHFAPQNTEAADYKRERLFYTRENACIIDAVRNRIEEWYPAWDLPEHAWREKSLLLASLLYAAAKHANTSGVFKAYHKGFGGHGKDALKRILSPIVLEEPILIDGNYRASSSRLDAAEFLRSASFDLVYLDPPYNCHQYGSNYFMLNSIALWDRPAVPGERTEDGRFLHKAGIRPDWIKTKSPFCYTDCAPRAFRSLLEQIDARFIILSYNNEGIIPFDELVDIMSSRGKLELRPTVYVTYRGGKQSMLRQNNNLELLLILNCKESPGRSDRTRIRKKLLEHEIVTMLKKAFHPERLRSEFSNRFSPDGSRLVLGKIAGKGVELETERYYRFITLPDDLSMFSKAELENLKQRLEKCLLKDKLEEAEVLIGLLVEPLSDTARSKYQERLAWVLKKFAFKKYRNDFEKVTARIDALMREMPERFEGMAPRMEKLQERAKLRFSG